MQQIRTFFRTLVNSMISPAYYNDVVRAPYSFSWKYFVVFNFICAVLLGLVIAVPFSFFNFAAMLEHLAAQYPQDLEITAGTDGIQINQPLPYVITMPMTDSPAMTEARIEEGIPANFITFVGEEDATYGAQVNQVFNSMIVVTPEMIYVSEGNEADEYAEVRAYAVPEFQEELALNSQLINGWVNQVVNNPFVAHRLYVPALALLLIIFIFPAILIWKSVTLAFYSVIVWAITSLAMKDKNLSFGKVFQIGQHSMTLISLLGIVVGVLSLFTLSGPFYVIAFLVWTLFVISRLRPTVAAAAVSAPKKTTSTTKSPTASKSAKKKTSKSSKAKKK